MSITVIFLGVCTHVRKVQGITDWLEPKRRVMLANSRTPWHMKDIPEHYPVLRILKEQVDGTPPSQPWCALQDAGREWVWNLRGVSLKMRNVMGPYVESPCQPPTLPEIRGFVVRPDLVGHTAPNLRDWFDASFDIEHGTVTGCLHGNEAYGVTVVVDPQPDTRAVIVAKSFSGDAVIEIHLNDGARAIVQNESEEPAHHNTGDDDPSLRHFGLHYMIGGMIPRNVVVPMKPVCPEGIPPCMPRNPAQSLGVGCSSSNWP